MRTGPTSLVVAGVCWASGCTTSPHKPLDEPAVAVDVGAATPPIPPTKPPAPASSAAPGEVATFYKRGVFSEKDVARASSGDGCIGTPEELAACKQLRPARCELDAPVGYWGEARCSGALRPPGPALDLPPPRCVCTCSDEYIRSADEQHKRRIECGNPP